MREYWQRKPLLIRQAVPEIAGRFCADDLFLLAQDDDIESRLVERRRGRWHLTSGPFYNDPRESTPASHDDDWHDEDAPRAQASPSRGRARGGKQADQGTLGHKDWSLLVQGVDLYDDDAAALLRRFRFIPDARLDDLMVSYAVDGGGVGPHFDSYDVFLLQAEGQRRWRISEQTDLRLDPAQPMKILQHFVPEQEWVLSPGDMLYLPPHIAHDGIAIGECITCSIGFRAADETELTVQFFHTLAEQIADARASDDAADTLADAQAETVKRSARSKAVRPRNRLYRDPEQPAVSRPAALPAQLVAHTQSLLSRVTWDQASVSAFLGTYLTEPKMNVYFDPPGRRFSRDSFLKRMLAQGLHLDSRSRMLYDERQVYLNGEALPLDRWSMMMAGVADGKATSKAASTRTGSSQAITARVFDASSKAVLSTQRKTVAKARGSAISAVPPTVKQARGILRDLLMKLADQRSLQADDFVTLAHDSPIVSAWHEWYLAGWIRLAVLTDRLS
ncbi:cupin domain-containing protein [Robbsia sp. KACC 23696]|uniref:cupin domain-containing protein n=1 Tax=Robbsia sp. KACC 23696 TaxID=3149231 RepID=UPI00325AD7DD